MDEQGERPDNMAGGSPPPAPPVDIASLDFDDPDWIGADIGGEA